MKVFISFFLEFLFLFLRYFSGMVATEPTNSQSLIHLSVQEGDTIAPPISTKEMGKGDAGHCLDFRRKGSPGWAEPWKFVWFTQVDVGSKKKPRLKCSRRSLRGQ